MDDDLKAFSTQGSLPADATLTGFFAEAVDRHGDDRALEYVDSSGTPRGYTYAQVFDLVRRIADALARSGIERGERVAIISGNRPEWALADYGCLAAGAVVVPIYPTLTAPQVAYVLRDSGARLVMAENDEQAEKAVRANKELDTPVEVVRFETRPPGGSCPLGMDRLAGGMDGLAELGRVVEPDGSEAPPHGPGGQDAPVSLGAFMAEATDEDASDPEAFRAKLLTVAPDDVATIIYTSGTTGDPKGVVLSHHNIASNVHASAEAIRLGPEDTTLSFLPLSHVFQRMVDYLCFWRGCRIAYPRVVPDTLMEDMRILRPTMVAAVPRIYERIHAQVTSTRGLKGRLVGRAVKIADRVAERRLAGKEPSALLRREYGLYDRIVFSKVKAAVGGRVRFFVSGGGPLAPELNRFFYSIGLTILEGYGLTETSPVTNVNSDEHFRIGSVGRPVAGTEIRIADDGEIEIRGPQVMQGYFNRPEATAAVIDEDGWFATGDIGRIDSDGFLHITDRKKDLIVTAGGKNVAPQPVENRIKLHPLVEQAVMIGDRRPYCIVLIVPDFAALGAWAADNGIDRHGSDLSKDPAVVAHIETAVAAACDGLASFETPQRVALLPGELTIDNGYLTPTMKVKRNVVAARMSRVINNTYAG